MRSRIIIAALFGVGVLTVSTIVWGDMAAPRRSAVVHFMRPTLVARVVVAGPVLFEHDDERMARGEPCTTIYRFDPSKNRREEVLVEFMCIPQERDLATKFEATCARASIAGPDRLVEYQFTGEREGHGVPYWKQEPKYGSSVAGIRKMRPPLI